MAYYPTRENGGLNIGRAPCVGADPYCPCQDGDPCHYLPLPPEFGPVTDLDGVPGMTTVDCSLSHQLLPIHLKLPYLRRGVVRIGELYLLVGGTAN